MVLKNDLQIIYTCRFILVNVSYAIVSKLLAAEGIARCRHFRQELINSNAFYHGYHNMH